MPLRHSLELLGFGGLASYAMARAAANIGFMAFHKCRVVAIAQATIADRLGDLPRGYTWRMVTDADLVRFPTDAGPDVVRERRAQGMVCLGVFDRAGEMAASIWLGRTAHFDPVLGIEYRLSPTQCWDTGLWVMENRRLTRAFSALWAAVGVWMREEGLTHSFSTIADYNTASIRSHTRLGAEAIGNVVVARCGSVQVTLGAEPVLGRAPAAAGGPAGRPVVRLPELPAVALQQAA